jgi:hypothetical protein
MLEITVVLAIYILVSVVLMGILWTSAAKRGRVRAPRYFFWIRQRRRAPLRSIAANEMTDANACWNGRSAGVAAAGVILGWAAMSGAQPVARVGGRVGSADSNQMVNVNALLR